MIKERNRLNVKIKNIKQELKILPEGKLILCFDGRRSYKWFQRSAADAYLSTYQKSNLTTNQEIREVSEYQNLLSNYFTPLNQELKKWTEEPYERSSAYQEQLIHKTIAGINVRSKSESFILTCLHANKIPYRYEAPLRIGNIIYYPDFTIRHPRTGEIFYWEHFGMMDKEDYARKNYKKLEIYHSQGIIPSVNLILTFETKEHPLSMEEVEKIVEHYFL